MVLRVCGRASAPINPGLASVGDRQPGPSTYDCRLWTVDCGLRTVDCERFVQDRFEEAVAFGLRGTRMRWSPVGVQESDRGHPSGPGKPKAPRSERGA